MAQTMLVSAAALLVLMVATWLLSLRLADVSVVDVAWGLASSRSPPSRRSRAMATRAAASSCSS